MWCPSGAGIEPTLVLQGEFDEPATEALRTRIEELTAAHRLGLVLDLRAAGELDAGQRGRLLRIAALTRPSLALVAIVANPDALREQIFASNRPLRLWAVADGGDAAIVLGAGTPVETTADDLRERHRRVIKRSLHWAARSAALGDYGDALGWLELVEAVDGRLPREWEQRRACWERSEPEQVG
ncbi:hypothetical protein Q5424_28130 [Conexibacter sp. JD483]|uniref:hypothetical protein n=1 Tax=unclassified Conexibacter TaxID=2627773 RepID=UPI0027228584|nr:MULTISPECIES: hypothetical protein [unclassified Conexibacter]MDO8189286.1 hypothetical protein [Conexibacter sp. CPCC 205706]MDO8201964.1 hypothetical protein [Conexibacter sp. CPCC 205762]MDR9372998.1 hypothetical protein [Conexibacter sp. JD483]